MSILLESESPKLFSILASIPGKKSLILDQSLSILISRLASFTQLQEHGIESVKWLIQTSIIDSGPSRVLIVSRPDADSVRKVAQIVKASKDREFTLLLVTRRTIQADQILEREGILADVEIKVLPIYYTQEEADFITVDVPPNPHSDPIVSPTEIFTIANALTSLQREYGKMNRIRGKGSNVTTLTNILAQLEADLLIEDKTELENEDDATVLGECIVLDRSTDLITPLLTQLTYEGLLYETYPIAGSVLELPPQVTTSSEQQRKIPLGQQDEIFIQLRSLNFSNVGPRLSDTASLLSSELDARHTMATTTQLKQFVSRIPNLQSSGRSLKMHIDLTERLLQRTKSSEFRSVLTAEQSLVNGFPETEISQGIESLIANGASLQSTLRLLCLWSLVHNGLKPRDYDSLTSKILHAFGHEVLLTLHYLQRHGLFVVRTPASEKGRGGWSGFSRGWQLNVDEIDEKDPSDVAYLYSGYAPLSMRILEGYLAPERFDVAENSALRVVLNSSGVGTSGSMRQFDSLMKNLRGTNVNVKRHNGGKKSKDKVIVIVFLGGCCATEVAGVRFLMQRLGQECIILTKGMIHGNKLMSDFIAESVPS